jgi:hypothetical protein
VILPHSLQGRGLILTIVLKCLAGWSSFLVGNRNGGVEIIPVYPFLVPK